MLNRARNSTYDHRSHITEDAVHTTVHSKHRSLVHLLSDTTRESELYILHVTSRLESGKVYIPFESQRLERHQTQAP